MAIGVETAPGPAGRGPLRAFGRFLRYGTDGGEGARVPFYRHRLFVRLTHWANALVMLVMLMSGLQIFNAHPALYLGKSADFDHPVLAMTAVTGADGKPHGITQVGPFRFDTTGLFGWSRADGSDTARGFPEWATLPGPQWLAMGRQWHLFFAWLFVINAALFLSLALLNRHLRDLAPTARDVRRLPGEILHHLKLRFPRGEAAKRYNVLQKLAYFSVIFLLGPLIVLTGLTMSPTMDAAFPFLPWLFLGRQTARTIHFACAFSFLAFFVIHMVMVVLSGTWNNLRSMLTGTYEIESLPEGTGHD